MLYCFDLDGTLIRSFLREGDKAHDYDDVEILDGRAARINGLIARDPAVRFALITNQAGVAMGYQTEQQVWAKMTRVLVELGLLRQPTTVHVAFNHPEAKLDQYRADDGMRKPGPGMILMAKRAHGAGSVETLFVGDMESDHQAALAARVPYMDAEEFFT
jgi:D-glycero-D-manno-heptose 1,7-bisphosphate phosphatase